MTTQWHGWHLSRVEDHQEVERLGSIHPEPVEMIGWEPPGYTAAGIYHRLKRFRIFDEARGYLDGRGNRAPVSRVAWEQELRGLPA